ncbi:hypothetical protein RUND412_010827 [Rhizina undulata]
MSSNFDPRILLRNPKRPDPWARNEAWRYTGPFTRWNRFKGAFPGLGIATVAFAGYCVFEALFLKDGKHADSHSSSGHH